MVSLREHRDFLRSLRIDYKGVLIEYLYHVFTQHANKDNKTLFDPTEQTTLAQFIKDITKPAEAHG